MWVFESAPLPDRAGFRLSVSEAGQRVGYDEVIDELAGNPGAARALIAALASVPFSAFFWEVVPVCSSTARQPFECVVLPAPALARAVADAGSFGEHFSATRSIVRFENLGGDATLIVPCPRAPFGVYPHLAAFLREAPPEQREDLFREVGRCARESLRAAPFWLSTSGLGVAWVHVRIDSRPKYYQYTPYRQPLAAPGKSR